MGKLSINDLKRKLEFWEDAERQMIEMEASDEEIEECNRMVNIYVNYLAKAELHATVTWDAKTGTSLDPECKLMRE